MAVPGRAFASWLAACLVCAAAAAAEDRVETLDVNGARRACVVHVPPSLPPGPRPLIVLLHAHGGTARGLQRISGMDRVADREGFLVAYPEGTGWRGLQRSWNAGHCCGSARSRNIDDTGFIRVLLDHLAAAYPVDASRVYAAGLSNGGMMAYRLACELSDRIAGIAVVAGSMGVRDCRPSAPVPVMIIHGTADAVVPYAGGPGGGDDEPRQDPPAASTAAWWAAHNRCAASPRVEERGIVRIERFTGCAKDRGVAFYTVRSGGHAWPGGERGWRFGVRPAPELPASEAVWRFFARGQ